jgi:hypothetical protein
LGAVVRGGLGLGLGVSVGNRMREGVGFEDRVIMIQFYLVLETKGAVN